MIEIRTKEGPVRCTPEEIVPRRFGLDVQRRCILLEYEVPKRCLLAHHPIEVDFGASGDQWSEEKDREVAERLKEKHQTWLGQVHVDQVAALVARLRVAAAAAGGAAAKASAPGGGKAAAGEPARKRPRRARVDHLPETARAKKGSKEPEIRKVFELIQGFGAGQGAAAADCLSEESVHTFVRDYLGFGKADAQAFMEVAGGGGASDTNGLTLDQFSSCYRLLNSFNVDNRKGEIIIRKPGALGGLHQGFKVNQVNLDTLEDCEAYICTRTAQAFVDCCKNCVILIGPCESSVFIRDCEDCDVWLAAQQLRTRDCKRCRFFLYSKTEPIIEKSEDLAFAPWCARYPGCSLQFEGAGFDPQRNFWNALFDFSGKDGGCNWRIMPLCEVRELCVEFDDDPPAVPSPEAAPDSPFPEVTHEQLCAAPLHAEESSGQSVSNIPQNRPPPPPAPKPGNPSRPPAFRVRDDDGRAVGREVGLRTRDP